jgi:hypothetical protein
MRRILSIVTGGAVVLSLVAATSASAASTVVVRPSSMGSWSAQTRDPGGVPAAMNDPYCHGSMTFVTGPATPPLGVGSAELRTGNGTTGGDCSTELRNSAYSGVKLSSLTALTYYTYVRSNNGQQFPYMELNIDTSGTGATPDDALFFEPPYQAPGAGGADCAHQGATVMLTWQRWDALTGCWWSGNGTLNPGTSSGTLTDYLAAFPNARIVNSSTGGGVHLLMGFASPSDPFDGNVDAVTIGVSGSSTTYDFEPNLPQPTNKDQCKGNGWMSYADAAGTPFKNQGDCVSYVATKGHNSAGG